MKLINTSDMTPKQYTKFTQSDNLASDLFYPSGKYQGHLHKVPEQEQRLSVDYDTLWIILS